MSYEWAPSFTDGMCRASCSCLGHRLLVTPKTSIFGVFAHSRSFGERAAQSIADRFDLPREEALFYALLPPVVREGDIALREATFVRVCTLTAMLCSPHLSPLFSVPLRLLKFACGDAGGGIDLARLCREVLRRHSSLEAKRPKEWSPKNAWKGATFSHNKKGNVAALTRGVWQGMTCPPCLLVLPSFLLQW